MMPHRFPQQSSTVAAGTVCPGPNCGALVISHGLPEKSDASAEGAWNWEFVCPVCGLEFAEAGSDLVFQSVPTNWLFAEVCRA